MSLWTTVNVMLALAPPTPPGTVPDERARMLQTLGMLVFMVFIMYWLVFRPQQKKNRDHAAMLKTLKTGDKIVTSGGILGVVVGIKDRTVSIRSADTKLEVLKSAVSEVVEKSTAEA